MTCTVFMLWRFLCGNQAGGNENGTENCQGGDGLAQKQPTDDNGNKRLNVDKRIGSNNAQIEECPVPENIAKAAS